MPFKALSCCFQVQLAVTPKVEGILEIVGIRWKLSGSVTGFHNFYTDLAKKKVMKGRRKVRRSPSNSMKFLVIAVHTIPIYLLSIFLSSTSITHILSELECP